MVVMVGVVRLLKTDCGIGTASKSVIALSSHIHGQIYAIACPSILSPFPGPPHLTLSLTNPLAPMNTGVQYSNASITSYQVKAKDPSTAPNALSPLSGFRFGKQGVESTSCN